MAFLLLLALSSGCTGNRNSAAGTSVDATDSVVTSEAADTTGAAGSRITAEMAFQGVSNYCHSRYDWSVAAGDSSVMYVQRGEETDSAYQVIFRSYTGAFVYFYVDKFSGSTRMEEYVPALDIRSEAGSINLSDYY